ncbi:MAG: EAL domain-containing protein [Lachnospiraceae bacterium]|nr:EAL domain-containing protein [Lachnospiraceae bacterium]
MAETTNTTKDIRRLVLIVDDEMVNREMLGFIVGTQYDVIFAENGRIAMDIIREESARISLILLDLMMPEMDGFEVMEQVQSNSDWKRIPIIVLTSEKALEVKSLQCGAVDFIPKPYDLPDVILARIRRSIELAEDKFIINATETDALTGLLIKEFFFLYCKREDLFFPGMPRDAVAMDVKHLRVVNDLHGREYGDRVLKAIADQVRVLLEKAGGIASRCNGDKFYLYLRHSGIIHEALDEFIQAIAENPLTEKISIRIGVYEQADFSLSAEQRFDRAVQAAKTVNVNYKSGVAIYDKKMREDELFAERLIEEMDTAIHERQFKVFYQPKYNITGDRPFLTSAEALIRWFHPTLGMISPGVFIPLFESHGLILKLDRYVWKEAAAQIKRWKETYGRTIPVSVNISRMDMYEPELDQEIAAIVKDAGLTPEEYLLEVTESAYTDNADQIIRILGSLRGMGFRIEMDDFGSGYSSLNMLSTLPIDVLKLDMKFVRNITSNEKDYQMVCLMIDIARRMSLTTIAEGVETADQLKMLKDAGCTVVQGYYFSKPVPPEDFKELIEKEIREASEC